MSDRLKLAKSIIENGFITADTINELNRAINCIENGKYFENHVEKAEGVLDIRETPDITVEQAVAVLIKHLKEDESYFNSWKANIAVAFQDEFRVDFFEEFNENLDEEGLERLVRVCNDAANRFLNAFIRYK